MRCKMGTPCSWSSALVWAGRSGPLGCASIALAVGLSAGCGGRTDSASESGSVQDAAARDRGVGTSNDADAGQVADAGGDAPVDGGVDAFGKAAADAAPPASMCTTDDDCLAVLDYRDGFSCWFPSVASKSDIAKDPCLVPWKPNARCSTPAPPGGCPFGAPIPVLHSCPAVPCVLTSCSEGTCMSTLGFGGECPVVDAGPPDCAALQSTYAVAATAAQQCDPTQDAATCGGEYPDSCGCEAPFTLSGRNADLLQCAFDDITNAHCAFPTCGATCAAVPWNGAATCAANASGTAGTCEWAK
jgi:hypothetical protein